MKANLNKLDIKWECSKLGTPKKLTSWDELYRMTELASEDKSKDMNPRILNAKKSEDWTHHTFSCIDIDRPNDGYVEKIMQSNVMQRFSNIIFIQKSYSGKLHIVYQIPDTDDFEIARLYICSYIQQFMDWCDEKFGIKFTATDKRQIRNSYRIATSSPELIYDEGDIDLKFASNKVQPVYINSNDIIANEEYKEWSSEYFFDLDGFMIMYVEEYFKYMVTNVGIQLCNEGVAEYPLYSKDADEVFDKSKGKLSELFINILNDSELDSKKNDFYKNIKKVTESVRSVIQEYYIKLFSNKELDNKKDDSYNNKKTAVEQEDKKGPINDGIVLFGTYSSDFQSLTKCTPYCYCSTELNYDYDNIGGLLNASIKILLDVNTDKHILYNSTRLYRPHIDIRNGIRFNLLPKIGFYDEKLKGKEAELTSIRMIKSVVLNAVASYNNYMSESEYSGKMFIEACPQMIVGTILNWIDTNTEGFGFVEIADMMKKVKNEWSSVSVEASMNVYKKSHKKFESKEEISKYGMQMWVNKCRDVDTTVMLVLEESFSDNNFDIKDIVNVLNNYNGTGVQTKRGCKWNERSVKTFLNKFGGLKGFKMRRLGKLKK